MLGLGVDLSADGEKGQARLGVRPAADVFGRAAGLDGGHRQDVVVDLVAQLGGEAQERRRLLVALAAWGLGSVTWGGGKGVCVCV